VGAPSREPVALGARPTRLRALLAGGRGAPGAWRDGLRHALRSVPRAAWACALVALANGLAWSLIVPPFEVPDENAHYAYVAQVAERGTLPHHVYPEGHLSPAEDETLAATGFYEIVGENHNPAPFSQLQQRRIEAAGRLPTRPSGDALSATNNPPLYYALETVPYKLAGGGAVLDRLAVMRVLSALMGAATVLLVYLFLSELLPAHRWAWSAGALVAALQPLFGFMSGGVNNDNLLYPMAAGVLWALARVFRHGLDRNNGILLGAFLGLGLVTKFTMLGFLPAVALALALGLRRAWPARRAPALRGAAWAVGLAAAPALLYLALDRLVWRHGLIPTSTGSVPAGPGAPAKFNLREELAHIWQLFLPHLWMRPQFTYLPLWQTWFKGFTGRFGWLDYVFPWWFYRIALAVCLLAGLLAAGELVRRRSALRRRLGELSVYALALLGLCVEVGVQSYREWVQSGGFGHFEQARYLLPLLCLYAAIAALAVRFGGRRWGPVLGVALVTLALAHDLFAQAITISRYYA
jgi:4-amino-4-deoxy-L-arabinose transferase-like glycosyltransferase